MTPLKIILFLSDIQGEIGLAHKTGPISFGKPAPRRSERYGTGRRDRSLGEVTPHMVFVAPKQGDTDKIVRILARPIFTTHGNRPTFAVWALAAVVGMGLPVVGDEIPPNLVYGRSRGTVSLPICNPTRHGM